MLGGASKDSFLLYEVPGLIVHEGFYELLIRVHDEWTSSGDRFIQWVACKQKVLGAFFVLHLHRNRVPVVVKQYCLIVPSLLPLFPKYRFPSIHIGKHIHITAREIQTLGSQSEDAKRNSIPWYVVCDGSAFLCMYIEKNDGHHCFDNCFDSMILAGDNFDRVEILYH